VRSLLPCLIIPLALTGCTGEYTGDKLPRFGPDAPSQFLLCPREGHYCVGVREHGSKEIAVVDDTWVYVRGGEEMGFRREAGTGRVIAYTRHEQFDLGPLPDGVKYLTWYRPYHREPLVPPDAVVDAVAGAVVESAVEAAFDELTGDDDDKHDPPSQVGRRRRD
jgi:hypothetical protein